MAAVRQLRLTTLGVIGFILLAALAVTVAFWLSPAPGTVEYHLRELRRSFDRYMGSDSHESVVTSSMEEFDRHRDVLVELGYFEKQVFSLRPIDRLSEEFGELANTVRQVLTDVADGLHLARFVWNDEDRVPTGLQVWVSPGAMPQWEDALRRFVDSTDGVESESEYHSEPESPVVETKRTNAEAIKMARAVAEEYGIDLEGWPEPDARFDDIQGKWWIHFTRHRHPGDHFSVSIDEATDETKLFRGR